MIRRRPKGRTIYSIDYLLNKQPKALQKYPRYAEMVLSLRDTPRLTQLKFNRRCYSLLHNAVIRPEHLENFYKTYRLPRHPFFALFLQMKRQYLWDRKEKKMDREQYISEKMGLLPRNIYAYMKCLAQFEQRYSKSGKARLFQQRVYPRSKAAVDRYLKYSPEEWMDFFQIYWEHLAENYSRISQVKKDQMQASFILGCSVSMDSIPTKAKVKERFRKLSKQYHPDAGGPSPMFIKIKWARDVLMED